MSVLPIVRMVLEHEKTINCSVKLFRGVLMHLSLVQRNLRVYITFSKRKSVTMFMLVNSQYQYFIHMISPLKWPVEHILYQL